MQDVTPRQAGVSLEGRFGGTQSGAGFNGGNVAKELGHGSKDDVKTDLIKGEGDKVQTGKNTQQRSKDQQRQQDDKGGQASSDKGGGAEEDDGMLQVNFEDYSKELMRYASVENIDKGHEEFWTELGGKPKNKNKIELTKFIRHMHTKRVNNEASVDDVKNEVAKAIGEVFKL